MQTIKAIQAEYKGCHFRSTLEARWAVFFDALAIEWEYEPKKLHLMNNINYIPDFKLTFQSPISLCKSCWVEVKPNLSFVQKWKSDYVTWTLCHNSDDAYRYYIADSGFRFYRYWRDQIEPVEAAIMVTKRGNWSLEKAIPHYGKRLDISQAIAMARSARFVREVQYGA